MIKVREDGLCNDCAHVKVCKVHDMFRDTSIFVSSPNNFAKVCDCYLSIARIRNRREQIEWLEKRGFLDIADRTHEQIPD